MDRSHADELSLTGAIRREEREDRATRPRSYGIGMGQECAMISANDRQHGGQHYKDVGYQHWDFVNDLGLDYFSGNATKYVSRYKNKNGAEDLEKGAHYCDKKLEITEEGTWQAVNCSAPEAQQLLFRFAASNNLDNDQYRIIFDIIHGSFETASYAMKAMADALSNAKQELRR